MSAAPIRIAIAGLGKIAHDQHVPALRASPDCTLVATVDPGGVDTVGVPHFPSLDALFASDAPVDAVAVCTPPQHRESIALRAIEAGKHVLLEKPPGATLAQVAVLERAAESAGVSLFAAWHSRFAGGVEPARDWLAEQAVRSAAIVWREDVRMWHPGQHWIWQKGGFGVFDPGINALSIITAILPGGWAVRAAALDVPSNCHAPVAAQLSLAHGDVPVSGDLDFLQTGPQTWDIRVETHAGELVLRKGGSELTLPGEAMRRFPDAEYAGIYRRFASLIGRGQSDADAGPLRLVLECYERGVVTAAAPFVE